MNEGLIPRRYAKALLEFARDKGEDGKVYDLMKQLDASFEANPALQQAMANPFVAPADKKTLLATAAGIEQGTDDEVMSRFVDLLTARDRISMVRLIAMAYIDLYRKANDIRKVTVTSAVPLSDDELAKIRNFTARHLGNKATIEFASEVNPALIGGFAISIGNERLDASVAGEFKELKRAMSADA